MNRTPASFTSEKIHDPEVRRLISKITIDENQDYTEKYPQEFNIRMEVTDRSGRNHVAQTSYPKGHQNNPLSDAEVEAKFRRLSDGVLSESQEQRVLEQVWELESSRVGAHVVEG